jgi:hypothetical protein
MASRKELKCVAKGLYGSFISRNNDVEGYWGIGRLSLFAQNQMLNVVEIDLLQSSILPQTRAFDWLVSGFCSRLRTQLGSKGIPRVWITSANITIDFNPSAYPKKYPPQLTWGKLFQLEVGIVDDKGKNYIHRGYGHCSPHDPSRERRSCTERY